MTFVLSLLSRDTVWLLADTRISWDARHSDHGVKVMSLDTNDGTAVLGYAGLGETPGGTQPSDWMVRVLDGWNMSMHDAMWKLDLEVQTHVAAHVAGVWKHLILAPAFVNDTTHLYVLGVSEGGEVAHADLRAKDPRRPAHLQPEPPRVLYGGTGGQWLAKKSPERTKLRARWVRGLRSLATNHERRRVSAEPVADRLAALNFEVSQNVSSVSPNCFVVWRHSPGSGLPKSGHHNYRGRTRVAARPFPKVASDPDGPLLRDWIMGKTHTYESDLSDEESLRATAPWGATSGSAPADRDITLR